MTPTVPACFGPAHGTPLRVHCRDLSYDKADPSWTRLLVDWELSLLFACRKWKPLRGSFPLLLSDCASATTDIHKRSPITPSLFLGGGGPEEKGGVDADSQQIPFVTVGERSGIDHISQSRHICSIRDLEFCAM